MTKKPKQGKIAPAVGPKKLSKGLERRLAMMDASTGSGEAAVNAAHNNPRKKKLTVGLTDPDRQNALQILRNRLRNERSTALVQMAESIAQKRKQEREQSGVVPSTEIKLPYGELITIRSEYYSTYYQLIATPEEKALTTKQGHVVRSDIIGLVNLQTDFKDVNAAVQEGRALDELECISVARGVLSYPASRKFSFLIAIAHENQSPESKYIKFLTDPRLKTCMSGELSIGLAQEVQQLSRGNAFRSRQYLRSRAAPLSVVLNQFTTTATAVLNDDDWKKNMAAELKLLTSNPVGKEIFGTMYDQVIAAQLPDKIREAITKVFDTLKKRGVGAIGKVMTEMIEAGNKVVLSTMPNDQNRKKRTSYIIEFMNFSLPLEISPIGLVTVMVHAMMKEKCFNLLTPFSGHHQLMESGTLAVPEPVFQLEDFEELYNPGGDEMPDIQLADIEAHLPVQFLIINSVRDMIRTSCECKTNKPSVSLCLNESEKKFSETRDLDESFQYLELGLYEILSVHKNQKTVDRLETIMANTCDLVELEEKVRELKNCPTTHFLECTLVTDTWYSFIKNLIAEQGSVASPSDRLRFGGRLLKLAGIEVEELQKQILDWDTTPPEQKVLEKASTYSFALQDTYQAIVRRTTAAVVDNVIAGAYGDGLLQLTEGDAARGSTDIVPVNESGSAFGNQVNQAGFNLLDLVLKAE